MRCEREAASPKSVIDRRDVSKTAGRLSWGVVDQAVGSASNFLLSLYVAKEYGPRAFGPFSLAFITFTVILNASRGTATDPLMVRYSGDRRALARSDGRCVSNCDHGGRGCRCGLRGRGVAAAASGRARIHCARRCAPRADTARQLAVCLFRHWPATGRAVERRGLDNVACYSRL
jgi:hypothetical protein